MNGMVVPSAYGSVVVERLWAVVDGGFNEPEARLTLFTSRHTHTRLLAGSDTTAPPRCRLPAYEDMTDNQKKKR